ATQWQATGRRADRAAAEVTRLTKALRAVLVGAGDPRDLAAAALGLGMLPAGPPVVADEPQVAPSEPATEIISDDQQAQPVPDTSGASDEATEPWPESMWPDDAGWDETKVVEEPAGRRPRWFRR
ncbi:MAG: hypothetical protein ACRD0J_14345, partial [Acidimicrobiales bacterium]